MHVAFEWSLQANSTCIISERYSIYSGQKKMATRCSEQRRWGTGFDGILQDFRFCQSAAVSGDWTNLAAKLRIGE